MTFALLHVYCRRNDNPIAPSSPGGTLTGVVHDQNGAPVPDAGVHYIYQKVSLSALSKPGGTCPSTSISYTVPASGHVTLCILRWYTRELIDTLVDQQQNAGMYRVIVDSRHLTNGVYLCQLRIDSFLSEQPLALLMTDTASLIQADPLTKTNAQGEFTLPYGVFGFALHLAVTSPSGPAVIDSVCISRSIQLVLYRQGYQTLVQPITIDTTQDLSETFTLRQ
ncbi:MAG TPA: hypothetical protein VK569_10125 [Bacteroidota bacterium]|nr:hypothetical protein [Bacteroidota bacterium]